MSTVQLCPECCAPPIASAPDIGRLTCGYHFWSVRPQWPTDTEFRSFAARVADAVMWAESIGFHVVPVTVGALVCFGSGSIDVQYPTSFGERGEHSVAFLLGFEADDIPQDIQVLAYYELGRAYRRRALGRKVAA